MIKEGACPPCSSTEYADGFASSERCQPEYLHSDCRKHIGAAPVALPSLDGVGDLDAQGFAGVATAEFVHVQAEAGACMRSGSSFFRPSILQRCRIARERAFGLMCSRLQALGLRLAK